MSTSRPLLSQVEAATACGVSRSTIRRRRAAGDLPGAVEDPKRGWLIPVEDLLAAGFRINAPAPPDAPQDEEPADGAGPEGERELRAELDRLKHEHEVAMLQEKTARLLAEKDAEKLREQLDDRAAHIADLQRALAALTAAPERAAIPQPSSPARPPVPVAPGAVDAESPATEQRRRWFRRR
ncbi:MULTISPECIES: helix-turn-helix transcriptional regulator [Streptomyces]|uniref:helix-turn-helix transcriptional regulator n=1 Tax=Streptomyces TaxID=1883 RepID=UPI0033E20657